MMMKLVPAVFLLASSFFVTAQLDASLKPKVMLFTGPNCKSVKSHTMTDHQLIWGKNGPLKATGPLESIKIVSPGKCDAFYIGSDRIWSTYDAKKLPLDQCITRTATTLASGVTAHWDNGQDGLDRILQGMFRIEVDGPELRWDGCKQGLWSWFRPRGRIR